MQINTFACIIQWTTATTRTAMVTVFARTALTAADTRAFVLMTSSDKTVANSAA